MIIAELSVFTPDLMPIEQAAHIAPWSEKTMRGCFGTGYSVVSLVVQQEMVGFYVSHEVADEITLMNIAVHPKHQGKGYGSVLLNELLLRSSQFEPNDEPTDTMPFLATSVFLEVRESNHAAIRLYERYGFNALGKRLGYYPPKNPADPYGTAIVYGRSA